MSASNAQAVRKFALLIAEFCGKTLAVEYIAHTQVTCVEDAIAYVRENCEGGDSPAGSNWRLEPVRPRG